jgi:cyanate permease
MFSDTFRSKALLIGIVAYLVITNFAFALFVHYWIPPNITDASELKRLAESDPTLLSWEVRLGAPVAILAGFVVTHFSGAKGLRNALAMGLVLVLYGVLGIYLHPSHAPWMQISKLLAPVPVCLFGGWLRLR